MAPTPRKVIINGAGLAGCALGALLHEQGWDVTLLEAREHFLQTGFTFTMQKPGWRVLDELGIGDALRAKGHPLPWISVQSQTGKELRRIHDVDAVLAGGVQLFRWEVNEALHARAAGCTIRFGTTVESFALLDDDEGISVQIQGEATPRHVDLLVGADGIHSKIRELTELGAAVEDETWSVNLLGPSRGEGFLSRYGKGCFLIVAPTTRAESNWVMTSRSKRPAEGDEEALRDKLRAALLMIHEDPQIADDAKDLYLVRNLEVHASRWSKGGRVVLVGDAAHGMWHTAGLGGSLALGDASNLAAHLETSSVADALEAYERERRRPTSQALKLAHRSMKTSLPPAMLTGLRNLLIRMVPTSLMVPPQIDV